MKASQNEPRRTRRPRLLLWASGLVIFYAVAGFLILPPIVRHVAVKQLAGQLNREVSIRQVKINPFTLSTTIRGLLIKDRDGQPFVSWDELYVNFQLSSFFGHAWVFKEISLSKPFVRAQMNKDYTFNFSDLVTKFSTNAPAAAPAAPAKPVMLHIGRLHIGGATAAVADFTPHEPFRRLIGPLDITLADFRTDPDNKNPYAFTGTTDAGETISWNGFFSLSPLRSEGQLKLFNFDLKKYAPLYQDLLRFEVRGGSIAFETRYRLAYSATNHEAAVKDLAWALRNFKVGEPGASNNLVEIPLLAVTGGRLDLQGHTASIDSVALEGATAFLNRDTNAAVNVVELAKPAESPTNAPGGILFLLRSVTNAVTLLLNSTNEWTATVRQINVTNCALHLEDHALPRAAELDLSEIALDARNLSNLPGTNLTANFSLRWNTNGAIRLGANLGFQPTSADIQLDLDRINLATLDTYLNSKLNVFILDSEVNLHGVVRLRPQPNDLPVVSFTGDTSLDRFHTVDGLSGEDLVKWDSLRFNGMVANLNPPSVTIREVVLDQAFARVIVETNRTLNLVNVLLPKGGATAKSTNTVAAAKPGTATNAPLQISIGSVIITNTAVDFTDRSLKPNVHLALQTINGHVDDLSSEQSQHAVLKLDASVDGVGPVDVTGTINPLQSNQTNEINISVKNVDLTPTGPYSGKFAGYGIAEGKLNLDLNYLIIGKKLTAKNVITLDQFTFGEKVNSPDATHLPVRLAVAILKDREGKIVLDVPIEGSLDDPKFRISKVVWRAIENILEKVATSPFSLLGALIGGGGEELGWQEFVPGNAELTAADTKKLDALVKALQARPGLKFEVSGSIDPAKDREGLERAALDREIREREWAKLRSSEQATNSVDQLVLTPADRADYVATLYAEATTAGKITPELMAANTNLAAYAAEIQARHPAIEKGASQLMAQSSSSATRTEPMQQSGQPDPMEAILLATFPVSEADLQALAGRRAQAVQAYLLQQGHVEAGRVFVTAAGAANLRRDGSRAYLQFE